MDEVVALAAQQQVVAAVAEDRIGAEVAQSDVVVLAAAHDVVALAAVEGVRPFAAVDEVVADVAVQVVGLGPAPELVGAFAAEDGVAAGVAEQAVVPVLRADHIVPAAAVQLVVAFAQDHVLGGVVGEDDLRALAAHQARQPLDESHGDALQLDGDGELGEHGAGRVDGHDRRPSVGPALDHQRPGGRIVSREHGLELEDHGGGRGVRAGDPVEAAGNAGVVELLGERGVGPQRRKDLPGRLAVDRAGGLQADVLGDLAGHPAQIVERGFDRGVAGDGGGALCRNLHRLVRLPVGAGVGAHLHRHPVDVLDDGRRGRGRRRRLRIGRGRRDLERDVLAMALGAARAGVSAVVQLDPQDDLARHPAGRGVGDPAAREEAVEVGERAGQGERRGGPAHRDAAARGRGQGARGNGDGGGHRAGVGVDVGQHDPRERLARPGGDGDRLRRSHLGRVVHRRDVQGDRAVGRPGPGGVLDVRGDGDGAGLVLGGAVGDSGEGGVHVGDRAGDAPGLGRRIEGRGGRAVGPGRELAGAGQDERSGDGLAQVGVGDHDVPEGGGSLVLVQADGLGEVGRGRRHRRAPAGKTASVAARGINLQQSSLGDNSHNGALWSPDKPGAP
ncbi:hypothetical protein PHZ_c2896 [Phenylobacterium zucineum HLK1]|uniref:Uncharacterized protein n=1 Tax=Phenylobacterium zucineum (strain HLK1) TaxID=450851 RepID=B4R8U0_PHEZH|nr:hypothetical protein PHZ_c2896 [Phenylobacterium zucineum HLK1]